MKIYYFDNCATTRMDDEVQKIIAYYNTEKYFNPSALANACADVRRDIQQARAQIASCLGANAAEIVFTSGGTEADNMAICGAIKNKKQGNIVVCGTEHAAVINTVNQFAERGVEIRFAKATSDGHMDFEDYCSKVDDNTIIAVMMHVNNETGAVNDIKKLAATVKNINARTVTFSDGVQAVGKIDVNVRRLGIDMYAFSGHKIHASKGVGALYIKKGVNIAPLVKGGGQESGLRSGTEYVGGIIGLSKAVQKAVELISTNTANYLDYKQALSNYMAQIPFSKINCTTDCAPHMMSVAFKGVRGEVLVHMLEDEGYIVGTSSACSAHSGLDRVFDYIGYEKDYVQGILRISFSKYNTIEEVDGLGSALVRNVDKLRKMTGVRL